jgi:2-phosphosulfolactate phosphatase
LVNLAMPQPIVTIIQGTEQRYPRADVNIVIDVIRAFTVAHIAFLRGAREIFLVNTVEEAFALRQSRPDYVLAGEIAGLPIIGFDMDNSPQRMSATEVDAKSLVQKTSNGVKATLLALNTDILLVTGFSNAANAALHAATLATGKADFTVNIIASHPSGDDDLACAEYIRDVLLGTHRLDAREIRARILASPAARKFFAPDKPIALDPRDVEHCAHEVTCNFVMRVELGITPPRIVTHRLS